VLNIQFIQIIAGGRNVLTCYACISDMSVKSIHLCVEILLGKKNREIPLDISFEFSCVKV
jgi:hypothetical protein